MAPACECPWPAPGASTFCRFQGEEPRGRGALISAQFQKLFSAWKVSADTKHTESEQPPPCDDLPKVDTSDMPPLDTSDLRPIYPTTGGASNLYEYLGAVTARVSCAHFFSGARDLNYQIGNQTNQRPIESNSSAGTDRRFGELFSRARCDVPSAPHAARVATRAAVPQDARSVGTVGGALSPVGGGGRVKSLGALGRQPRGRAASIYAKFQKLFCWVDNGQA